MDRNHENTIRSRSEIPNRSANSIPKPSTQSLQEGDRADEDEDDEPLVNFGKMFFKALGSVEKKRKFRALLLANCEEQDAQPTTINGHPSGATIETGSASLSLLLPFNNSSVSETEKTNVCEIGTEKTLEEVVLVSDAISTRPTETTNLSTSPSTSLPTTAQTTTTDPFSSGASQPSNTNTTGQQPSGAQKSVSWADIVAPPENLREEVEVEQNCSSGWARELGRKGVGQTTLQYIAPTMVEGKPVIHVSTTQFSQLNSKNENLVIGSVVGSRPDFKFVKQIVELTWKPKKPYTMKLYGKHSFSFQFTDEADRQTAIETGSFHIASQLFRVQMWKPFVEADMECLKTIPVWVLFKDFPMEMWNPDGFSRVGSAIGEPLFPDRLTEQLKRTDYARLCIEVKEDNEFLKSVPIILDNKKVINVQVEYNWRPSRCSHCKVFGHDDKSCVKQQQKQGSTEVWVHREGRGLPRNPQNISARINTRPAGNTQQQQVAAQPDQTTTTLQRAATLGNSATPSPCHTTTNVIPPVTMSSTPHTTVIPPPLTTPRQPTIPPAGITTTDPGNDQLEANGNALEPQPLNLEPPPLPTPKAITQQQQPTTYKSVTVGSSEEWTTPKNTIKPRNLIPKDNQQSIGMTAGGEKRVVSAATSISTGTMHEPTSERQKEKTKGMTEAEGILARWEARQLKEVADAEASQKKKVDASSSLSSKSKSQGKHGKAKPKQLITVEEHVSEEEIEDGKLLKDYLTTIKDL